MCEVPESPGPALCTTATQRIRPNLELPGVYVRTFLSKQPDPKQDPDQACGSRKCRARRFCAYSIFDTSKSSGSRPNMRMWGLEMPGPAFIGVGSAGGSLGNAGPGVCKIRFGDIKFHRIQTKRWAPRNAGAGVCLHARFSKHLGPRHPDQACSSRKCRSLRLFARVDVETF